MRSGLSVLSIGVLLGLVVLAPRSDAVTVDSQPTRLTKPDGMTIVAIPVGAEFNQYWELLDGHTVVRDPAGWWRLGVLDAAGRLVAAVAADSFVDYAAYDLGQTRRQRPLPP